MATRAETFHFLVTNLVVPFAWPVGPVTFRPPGWLRRQLISQAGRKDVWGDVPIEFLTEGTDDWNWASAHVTLARRSQDDPDIAGARGLMEDAVAVLRLFQRFVVPTVNVDRQTFGLAGDVGDALEWHWRIDRDGFAGMGGQRLGVVGAWTFTPVHARRFRTEGVFRFLADAILRHDRPAVGVTPWTQRVIVALRVLNQANAMQRDPLRIILAATALEALLGDQGESNSLRVNQRAAFLTCVDANDTSHGATRPACAILIAKSRKHLGDMLEQRARKGLGWRCSAFEDVDELTDDRNAALHDATDQFGQRAGLRAQRVVDEVLIAAVRWVQSNNATHLKDLDDAIAALPAAWVGR